MVSEAQSVKPYVDPPSQPLLNQIARSPSPSQSYRSLTFGTRPGPGPFPFPAAAPPLAPSSSSSRARLLDGAAGAVAAAVAAASMAKAGRPCCLSKWYVRMAIAEVSDHEACQISGQHASTEQGSINQSTDRFDQLIRSMSMPGLAVGCLLVVATRPKGRFRQLSQIRARPTDKQTDGLGEA